MTINIDLSNNIFLSYGTPILRQKLANAGPLCGGLKRIVLAQEAAHPEFRTGGRVRSNQSGWRSKPDLLSWPGTEIGLLQDAIVKGLEGPGA